MAEIARVTARWTGFTGAPGFTVMHFRDFGGTFPTVADVQVAVDRVRAFFDAIKVYIPSQVSIQVLGEVEVLQEDTGTLIDVLVSTTPAVVTGTSGAANAYAAALGAVVSWRTGIVRNGRRIRGRTFVVPLSSTAFDNSGTLISGAVTALNTAATALRDATTIADLGVYARPTAPGASDGLWALVTGHQVPDMGSVLRSRRD